MNQSEIYKRVIEMDDKHAMVKETIQLTSAGVLDDIENMINNILNMTFKSPKEVSNDYKRIKKKWLEGCYEQTDDI